VNGVTQIVVNFSKPKFTEWFHNQEKQKLEKVDYQRGREERDGKTEMSEGGRLETLNKSSMKATKCLSETFR
jgi:hypothetical protein